MTIKEVIEIMNIISGIIIAVAGPLLLAGVIFIIRLIKKNVTKDKDAHQKLTNALVAIQKNYFIQIYYTSKKEGGIRLYERDMLEEMHKSYKELGGNSYIDKIMEEIKYMKTLD